MKNKKLALYYGVSKEVIGVRECLHDWEEGDVITTDGAKTEIYAVFDSTHENMMVLASMFIALNNRTSMCCLKNFIELPANEDDLCDNEDLINYLDLSDLLSVMICTAWTVKKHQWPDYEKRLDFMEECVERII